MHTENYSPPLRRTGFRIRLLTLASALLLAPAAMAQVTVPAGNPDGGSARRPLGTWYGYERSAVIYTPAEIGTSGSITAIGFYVNSVSTPGAAPTKVYLKTVTNSSFAAATTVAAEETGATLVYDSTVPATSFTANTWVSLPLTAAFSYNGTSNLEVIVETNATGGGNETSTGKGFRSHTAGATQAQYWSVDTAPPTTTGTLSNIRPNIQLTGLTVTCPAATGLAVSNVTTTGAQVAFTPGTGNTSYTVTYYPTATPATVTTVTPAPTASPVTLTGLASGTGYTVSVVANCSGGTRSQQATVSFTTSLSNDDCATAITLTPSTGLTCNATNGSTAGATQSQPSSACSGSTSGIAGDVWYKFVATSTSHTVTVSSSALDGVLQAFSGACGTLTDLSCIDATTTGAETLPLTGLTPGQTYYVRYYGYTGSTTTPAGGAFTICVTTVPANDAGVTALYTVGKVSPLASPVAVQAVIRNNGTSAITNRVVTLNVSGATTYTNQQTIASLAPGASATVTFAPYPVTATTGNNAVIVTLPTDDDTDNNTSVYTQAVTAAQLSYYDDAKPLNATGVGVSNTTPGGALVTKFTVAQSTRVAEVRLNFPASATSTSTYQVQVYDATGTGGLPGATPLFTSATQNRPTTAGVVTIPVTGSVVVNGPFYIGLREISGNVGIGYQLEVPLRAGTFLFQTSATGAWTDVNTTTLTTRLAIEVGLAIVTATRSASLSEAISLFPNPSNGNVTLDVRAKNLQSELNVQVINVLGQTVHAAKLRNNVENQLNLSSLAAGIYTVKVQAGNEFTVRQLSLTK